jgi:predicted ATPase
MLTRFTRRQTEEMVERVAGGKRLPAEVLKEIVAKTDGVPLFVEELTKMVPESGLVQAQGDEYLLTGPPLRPDVALTRSGSGTTSPVA